MIQLEEYTKKRKTRLIVKKGIENIALKLDDVALIYTESKVVFVIANDEKNIFTIKIFPNWNRN